MIESISGMTFRRCKSGVFEQLLSRPLALSNALHVDGWVWVGQCLISTHQCKKHRSEYSVPTVIDPWPGAIAVSLLLVAL